MKISDRSKLNTIAIVVLALFVFILHQSDEIKELNQQVIKQQVTHE